MKTISASDAKQYFGELVDTVIKQPVMVEKHGRPMFIAMSLEDFNHICEHGADREWAKKVKLSAGREFLDFKGKR